MFPLFQRMMSAVVSGSDTQTAPKTVVTSILNESLITVYLWKNEQEGFHTKTMFDTTELVGNYYADTNTLRYTKTNGTTMSYCDQITCYYYDEPEQESFVTTRNNVDMSLSTVGDKPQFFALPAHNKHLAEISLFKCVGIKKFNNPKDGFDILFNYNHHSAINDNNIKQISKVFIRKLLGIHQNTSTSSNAIVTANSTSIMQNMPFTWLDERSKDDTPRPIGVAIWHPDISSITNSELELETMDIASLDSHVVGNLYRDNTFRVSELSSAYPWLMHVRITTGWLCKVQENFVLVANHDFKSVVSVSRDTKLIDLPFNLSSSTLKKVAKAFTHADASEDNDYFYITLTGLENHPPTRYSLGELTSSVKFADKYNTEQIHGVWIGKSQYSRVQSANLYLWPDVDLDSEIDRNKKREETTEKAQQFREEVDGHCYPKNKLIKLGVLHQSEYSRLGAGRRIASIVPGTYYYDAKNKMGAFIAVINELNLSRDNDLSQKANLVNEIKKHIRKALSSNNKMKAIEYLMNDIINEFATKLVDYSKGNADQLITLLDRRGIVQKIINHYDIENHLNTLDTATKTVSTTTSNVVYDFGNRSAQHNLVEIVTSDLINQCQLSQIVYVMLAGNTGDLRKNLQLPILPGYTSIKFSDERLHIIYPDNTIDLSLNDLLYKAKKDFLSNHLMLSMELTSPLNFTGDSYKRYMLNIWKDATSDNNPYHQEIRAEQNEQNAAKGKIPSQHFDVAHLYLKNNTFIAHARNEQRTLQGWMVDAGSEQLLFLESPEMYNFIFLKNDNTQYHHTDLKANILRIDRFISPKIESMALNEEKTHLVGVYSSGDDAYGDPRKESKFKISLADLRIACRVPAEPQKQSSSNILKI